jgi:cell division protease FtsH
MACMLAGRAAESVILDAAMVGSGGHPGSDLANATHLAIELETALGCSNDRPLIYRPPERTGDALLYHPPLADQVNARLERAMEMAMALLRAHRSALLSVARSLTDNLVLDGEQVRGLIVAMGRMEKSPEAVQI